MGLIHPVLVVDLFLLRVAIEDAMQEALQREVERQISDQIGPSILKFETNVAEASLKRVELNIDGYTIKYIHDQRT